MGVGGGFKEEMMSKHAQGLTRGAHVIKVHCWSVKMVHSPLEWLDGGGMLRDKSWKPKSKMHHDKEFEYFLVQEIMNCFNAEKWNDWIMI